MLVKPLVVLESFELKISDLSDIANTFAQHTQNSDVLFLKGKVGSGKTEFARLLIKAKAIKENAIFEEVSSPTFSLVQNYEFQYCRISHIDLYRVNSAVELVELGIPDIFDSQITLLEWPEILETKKLPRYLTIKIKETKQSKEDRVIKIEFFGDRWGNLSGALLQSGHFNNEKI